jgi:hypothetical protein
MNKPIFTHPGYRWMSLFLALAWLPIRGEDSAPTLSDQKEQELFDALDLTAAPLKPVADALAGGDHAAARHALAEYFRHSSDSAWPLVTKSREAALKNGIAEKAVKGIVQGGYVYLWHEFPEGKIDWMYDAPRHTPGEPANNEWQWELCRMMFWDDLSAAFRATKDESYAEAWVNQLRSFVSECPPPEEMQNGAGSAWRTLEAGVRMVGSWPTAFYTFRLSSDVSDNDILLYVDSCLEHGRYLKKFNTRDNWVTVEMAGLYTDGALFPEFKEAADWRKFALERMNVEETKQFLPDGAQEELSTMYHNVSLTSWILMMKVATNTGHLDELPQDFTKGLEKGFDFDLYMLGPDRSMPRFNDSSSWPLQGTFHDASQFFPDRPDYLWITTNGKEGNPPAETSHAFSWAGYYAMRSGWESDANFFVLRAGPLGRGHQHQDKLNVILWPYGRQLLFNSGGGSYEDSEWRRYSIDTFSKNSVLVDGKPQFRDRNNSEANVSKAPIDARWESTPDHDFAVGVYNEGYGSLDARLATHTRRVLFVKPDLFLIADTLVPNDAAEHTYQARWHLLTTQTEEDQSTDEVITTDENQPNLAILPLNPEGLEVSTASGQTKPELLGWEVGKDTPSGHTLATTVLHTRKGSGTQSFLTLLLPLRAGSRNPISSVAATNSNSTSVVFKDGRKFLISIDSDPAGGMEVTETLSDGTSGRHIVAGRQPKP